MRVREIAQFIHVSLSNDHGRASLEHKSISTLYRGQRYNIDSMLRQIEVVLLLSPKEQSE